MTAKGAEGVTENVRYAISLVTFYQNTNKITRPQKAGSQASEMNPQRSPHSRIVP